MSNWRPCALGLDEAILGSMNSCGDPEQDGKKIADLLKYGAHSLVGHTSSSAWAQSCSAGSVALVQSPMAIPGIL